MTQTYSKAWWQQHDALQLLVFTAGTVSRQGIMDTMYQSNLPQNLTNEHKENDNDPNHKLQVNKAKASEDDEKYFLNCPIREELQ